MNRRRLTLQALNTWEKRPFSYGVADCCQFAAHVANVITGRDYTNAFPIYSSEEEANRIIATWGGLAPMLRSILGEPSEQLEDGDPVLLDLPGGIGEVLAIKLGVHAVGLAEARMVTIGPRYWREGWHLCRP